MRLIEKAEWAALLLLARCVAGCHALTPAQQAQADLYECRVAVLLPYIAPALDTSQAVRDLMLGRGSLDQALAALGYAEEDAGKIKAELRACEPQPAVVTPEPPADETQSLVAPPPAYGNRVL